MKHVNIKNEDTVTEVILTEEGINQTHQLLKMTSVIVARAAVAREVKSIAKARGIKAIVVNDVLLVDGDNLVIAIDLGIRDMPAMGNPEVEHLIKEFIDKIRGQLLADPKGKLILPLYADIMNTVTFDDDSETQEKETC